MFQLFQLSVTQYLWIATTSGPCAMKSTPIRRHIWHLCQISCGAPKTYFVGPGPGPFKTGRGLVEIHMVHFVHRFRRWKLKNKNSVQSIISKHFGIFTILRSCCCQPFGNNTFTGTGHASKTQLYANIVIECELDWIFLQMTDVVVGAFFGNIFSPKGWPKELPTNGLPGGQNLS